MPALSLIFLAARQTDKGSGLMQSILIAGGLLIGLVVLGAIVLTVLKNWADVDDGAEAEVPFSLEDLRQMYISGQLSDEEYETAREKVIAMSQRLMGTDTAYDEEEDELGEELIGPDNNGGNDGAEPETT